MGDIGLQSEIITSFLKKKDYHEIKNKLVHDKFFT